MNWKPPQESDNEKSSSSSGEESDKEKRQDKTKEATVKEGFAARNVDKKALR